MRILTSEEFRRIDQLTLENYGIPGLLLMENAGIRVVETIDSRVKDIEACSFAILCGKGNNGGDGFVVARQLIERGIFPSVFLFASPDSVSGDARTNLDILTRIGCLPTVIDSAEAWESARLAIRRVDIIADALFGTGLSRPIDGLLKQVISSMGDDFPNSTIVSIDVPSGCTADSADVRGPTVEADITITFTALKKCLVFAPACHLAGEVVIADIGNPPELMEGRPEAVELLDLEAFPEALFPRDDDTNKGSYGKVLVIGGSRGKSGAAAMASQAALQSGAGLVTAAVPESVLSIVAAHMPELMTEPLPETRDGAVASTALESGRIDALITDKSVVALGPGIGDSAETFALVRALISSIHVPLILDADGINSFIGHTDALNGEDRTSHGPLVITPHPGEMARLVGEEISYIVRSRLSVACDFAKEHIVYVVLKGFRTIIACPDGRTFVNPTGNPGMATAGSGDILTGMIAGILGQPNLGTFDERLCLAVYLHGLAGDLATAKIGEEPLLATDILSFLPEAWAELRGKAAIQDED